LLFAITLYWLPLQLYFIATAEYYHIELFSFSRISTTYKWEKNDFEIIKFHSLSSLNLHLLPIFTKFGLLSECFVLLFILTNLTRILFVVLTFYSVLENVSYTKKTLCHFSYAVVEHKLSISSKVA
jgi:hypothetical protein